MILEKDLEEISKRAKELNYKPLEIQGMWKEITSMKEKLKDILGNEIFSISYGIGDCLYFGWSKEDLDNMIKVKDALTNGIYDLLAITEKALNKKTGDE